MAHAEDATLAALSSQMMPANPAAPHYGDDDDGHSEEQQERLATSLNRRPSSAAASNYTSATGGTSSVYQDAHSNYTVSASGSQSTIQRPSFDALEDDRHPSQPAATVAAGHDEPSSFSKDVSTSSVGHTPVTNDSARAASAPAAGSDDLATSTGIGRGTDTMASTATTIRPAVLPPSSASSSANSSDTRAVNAVPASEKGALQSTSSNKFNNNNEKTGHDADSNDEKDATVVENPEMAHLTDEQRAVVLQQVHLEKRAPVSFGELFRYATKFELFLNAIGLLAAIVAGAAQPLMTVVFGALTTAFTDFSRAVAEAEAGLVSPEQVAASRDDLYAEVNRDVLYLVAIGCGMFICTFLYTGTWIFTGEVITRRVRENYLRSVLRQNVALHDAMGAGSVTQKIETDTHLIQEGISDKISITVMFLSTFVTGFVVALVRNWRLALVISTIIPCIATAGAIMTRFISEYKRRMLEETARGSTLAEEVISSVRNTHAFGTQKRLTAMYDVSNAETLHIGLKSALANGFGLGVFFFIIYSSYALAFYYGTTLILQGRANAGEIVNVFFAILIGSFSLAQITPNMQALSFARAAASSIYAVIDRVPPIDSSSTLGLKPSHVDGEITLEGVDFIYPSRPAVQVLYGFSGVFPRGKMTALVGGSGSGKSTIIGLIERFYDPVGGSVRLDGVELKELNVRWLRTQIGLVSQEPTLFATTVAGNIEHGLIGTAFEDEPVEQRRQRVIEAAKQANADGFISALPEGYDTMIGERGMLLSGGQKQRIAIARAIVGDPAILLLDEATSALDTNSEAIVQDALDRAAAGRTTVVIAHRLSTIRDADQIIVLTAGKILESAMTTAEGSAHDRLLRRKDGAYSKLVNAQKFREQEEKDGASADSDVDSQAAREEEAAGAAAVPGELSPEELRKMAENEKPQFETLKRSATGRSAASEALERRQRERGDLEKGGHGGAKKHGLWYLMMRMVRLNRGHYLEYVWAFIASIAAGAVYPVFGIVFGGAIGVFSLDPERQRDELRSGGDRYALYCFIIALVATLSIVVQNLFFGRTGETLARAIRLNAFRSYLRQDIEFYDRDENSTGHVVNTIADWAQKVTGAAGVTAGVIIQSCFTIIIGVIIGLSYGPKVAAVGTACIPLTVAAGIVRLRVVVLKDEKNKKSHEQSAQMACEAASAIRTVASLTREDDVNRIYSGYLDAPMRESNRTAIYSNAFYSLSQALSFFVIGLIFWYGSRQLASQELTSETFFITMISIVFGSIQAGNVFSFVPDMSKAKSAAASAVALMDARPDIDAEEPTGGNFDNCVGHIRFNNVHYRYASRPHVRVLRGLDLEVQPGQFAAIVGPSGCGKSTLIQLVERFYDPLAGKVEVDDQDISMLNVQEYRKNIALVSQEPTLYAGTVRFNITLGAAKPAEEISQEEVERACRDANIHDFVMSLPDGYDTEVGGKGTQLSGGQKQRIAIARALIRNPKILLLDEATSALDSESEKVVQTALDQAAKGRTTIAVAHRLSTIQAADVIFVLRDGRVVEKGTHFDLLAKKGAYAELVAQQDLEKH